MPVADVLLPTCDRPSALIMTLCGLASQEIRDFRVLVADQSERSARHEPVVTTLARVLEARGNSVEWHNRTERKGIAEQRDYLLRQARADAILFLDDDVFMEPWVFGRLIEVLQEQHCGFVGAFPTGLSFANDVRPGQQIVEFWGGQVQPEAVEPESAQWERAQLHRAANAYHVSRRLPPGAQRLYKVAWVASCALYDRRKLEAVGGFSFWPLLPRYHSGEEVLAQNLLMRIYGGCAIMPSGTYHAEVPSTILNNEGSIDGHALDLLPEMTQRYIAKSADIAASVRS